MASPSTGVWAGHERPGEAVVAAWATSRQPTLSRLALVATTPMVVLRERRRRRTGAAAATAGVVAGAVDVAEGVHRDERGHDEVAVGGSTPTPSPPGRRVLAAAPLADGRPGAGADRAERDRRRRSRPRTPRTPSAGPGRTDGVADGEVEQRRAPTTIGTGPPRSGSPMPRSSQNRITPSAAASPNAEPPVEHDRVEPATSRAGSSSANSRVAGAPPRTSPDATVPSGNSTTVQPVRGRGVGPVPDPHAGDVGDHGAVDVTRSAAGRGGPMPHTIS